MLEVEVEGFTGDAIKIGHEVTVLVLGVGKDTVQLGVAAPQPLTGMSSEEINKRVQAVQAQAAAGKRSKPGSE